ncbi:glycolate oxidase FAD binding subunit [Alteribacillus persepolensis]|uniref:Glycolate oxidase FAD binding subunit n=1 Tax=Alteribacillus persepolensis TaxID=568899 RepID=A0A1G8A4R8_9BACI|nr:FAD-binding oxidoreductase [Alteribacillus persepolensis]SDH15975.1 glycolate oxidase FAD binding subunit [Alteribacillus persepolensis]
MGTSDVLQQVSSLVKDSAVEENTSLDYWYGNDGKMKVFPRSEDDIRALLQRANDNRHTVAIAGNGSKRGFGGKEAAADILLSLSSYKGIIEHTVGDMTIIVKAGTLLRELQDYLREYRQQIPLDPAHPESATIGGVIAANDSGPKRLGYGSARDHVIGLKVAYANGDLIRTGGKVVKNVAGYDMNKLFVGSMGTLGVITEAALKLRPLPKYESVLFVPFEEANQHAIREFAVEILDSMVEPVSLELFNPRLSEKLLGHRRYTLAIALEDVETSVHYQEEKIGEMAERVSSLTVFSEDDAKQFWKRFYSAFPNSGAVPKEHATDAVVKVGVKNLDVLSVLNECAMLEDAHNVSICAHGGLGHGLCQIHVAGAQEDVLAAISSIRKTAVHLQGYAVVKHLPLALRQMIDIWGEKPSYFFLLEGIKKKMDPFSTLNPKRFIGGL